MNGSNMTANQILSIGEYQGESINVNQISRQT